MTDSHLHKTVSDFAHFYATDLLKELRALEAVRKVVLRNVLVLVAITAAVMAGIVWFAIAFELRGQFPLFAGFLCLGAAGVFYRYLTSGYVHEFKIRVIQKIVAFIDPGLEYWPTGCVEKWRFTGSRIFETTCDRVRGDDLVKGTIGMTKIEFSELTAEHKREGTTTTGRRRERWSRIFKGLFFVADFNKKFYGKVVVLPDTAERVLGGAGSFLQSLNKSRGELIKLEDPEFEKYFVVYGDDQIESRYVLSTSLMERILEFRKKTGRRISLSFVGSEMFVAIPYGGPLFEPRVFTSITEFKCCEEYFEHLNLALGVVDDLHLNTRIWDKREPNPDAPTMLGA